MTATLSVVQAPEEQGHVRITAARRVYAKLRRFEKMIDETLIAGGELTAAMPAAAAEAGLSIHYGSKSLAHVLEAISAVAMARTATGSAHWSLADINREIRANSDDGSDDFGGGGKPQDGPRG